MKVYEYDGKTEQDIKKQICNDLSVDEDDLLLKVRSKEDGGLFKSKKQTYDLLVKDEIIEYIKKLLNEVIMQMGLEVNIECMKRKNHIKINLYTNNNGIIIGKGGRTIESLQKIVKYSILNNTGFYVNIILDVEDYKEKQQQYIKSDVLKMAMEVKNSGKERKLDFMNSYERRLIHETLSQVKGIDTTSEGEEPCRYVIIKPSN